MKISLQWQKKVDMIAFIKKELMDFPLTHGVGKQ